MQILIAVVVALLFSESAVAEPFGGVWRQTSSTAGASERMHMLQRHEGSATYAELLADVQADGANLLTAVNDAVNAAIAYRPEQAGSDIWQTPGTSLALGHGDCEDYAILKYSLLRDLGISPEYLWIVIGEAPSGVAHAVLAVASQGGWVILDNLTSQIWSDSSSGFGALVYILNQDRMYLYLGG